MELAARFVPLPSTGCMHAFDAHRPEWWASIHIAAGRGKAGGRGGDDPDFSRDATEPRVASRLAPLNFSGLRLRLSTDRILPPDSAVLRGPCPYPGLCPAPRPGRLRYVGLNHPVMPVGTLRDLGSARSPSGSDSTRCPSDTLTRRRIPATPSHTRRCVRLSPGFPARRPLSDLAIILPRRGFPPLARSRISVSPADPPAPGRRPGWLGVLCGPLHRLRLPLPRAGALDCWSGAGVAAHFGRWHLAGFAAGCQPENAKSPSKSRAFSRNPQPRPGYTQP